MNDTVTVIGILAILGAGTIGYLFVCVVCCMWDFMNAVRTKMKQQSPVTPKAIPSITEIDYTKDNHVFIATRNG